MVKPSWLTKVILSAIKCYQQRGGSVVHFATSCNFQPTCSHYTYQAIERFGILKGIKLALGRIQRCNNPDCIKVIEDPVPTVYFVNKEV